MANEPILARMASKPELAIRWCQRNRLLTSVLCLLIFLAIAGPAAALTIYLGGREIATRYAERGNLVHGLKQERVQFENTIAQLRRDLVSDAGEPSSVLRSVVEATALDDGETHQNAVVLTLWKKHSASLLAIAEDPSETIRDRVFARLSLAVMESQIGKRLSAIRQLDAVIADFADDSSAELSKLRDMATITRARLTKTR